MKSKSSSSDIESELGPLTDEDLYRLHVHALGLPKKKHGGKMFANYRKSEFRRVLTVADSFLYLLLAACGFNLLFCAWCIAGILLCAFNVCAGPLSLSAGIVNLYLDTIPLPAPNAETLHLGSPESISLIADFVTAPAIKSAETYIAQCQANRVPLDDLIQKTTAVETRLVKERDIQKDSSLLPAYGCQITEARQAIAALRAMEEEWHRRESRTYEELQTIKRRLADMHILAQASYELRIVKDHIIEHTQEQDEARAAQCLQRITDGMEIALANVCNLQSITIARARAAAEVDQLSHAC